MSHLITGQRDLSGRIARAYENLKKLGANKFTKANVSTRLEALRRNWAKFEAQHDKLIAMAVDPDLAGEPYFKEGQPSAMEEIFLEQEALLVAKLEELINLEQVAKRTVERYSRDDSTAADTDATGRSKASLPRIPLPNFDGRHKDWPSFQGLFQSLVVRDATLSDSERLHYLRGALSGDAAKLLRNMPVREENFEAAWKLLEDRYDNQRLAVKELMTDIFSLPLLTKESGPDIKRIYYTLCDFVTALATLKRPYDATGDWLVHLVAERLDPQSRREWETHIARTKTPPAFSEMKDFLEGRVNTVEALEESSKGQGGRTPRPTHTA